MCSIVLAVIKLKSITETMENCMQWKGNIWCIYVAHLHFQSDKISTDKTCISTYSYFLFCREISEPLEKTLIRISRNFQKKEKKKKKGPSSPTKKFASNNVGVGGLDTALLCRADGCLAYDLAELTNGHWETGMRVLIKEDLALTGASRFGSHHHQQQQRQRLQQQHTLF